MEKLKVKIKKLVENAVIPNYAHQSDAGMDLVATSRIFDEYGCISYGTGLGFEIPKGYVGLIFPRSSNCKKDLLQSNSVSVIDSGYRGEVYVKFKPSLTLADKSKFIRPMKERMYNVGERIGQIIIMPYPHVEFEEVGELSASDRGVDAFGSTGK